MRTMLTALSAAAAMMSVPVTGRIDEPDDFKVIDLAPDLLGMELYSHLPRPSRRFHIIPGNVYQVADPRVRGHIERRDNGRVYRGLGLKDLQRRLSYWETRVADFAAVAATVEGEEAKKSATKTLKSGEKLLKTIRKEIDARMAA